MDCATFDRWLDEGRPAAGREPARRHAAACPRCGAELTAAHALDDALAQRFATAPSDFTERLFRRIAVEEPLSRPAPPLVEPSVPWWLRIFQDPAIVLSCLLAAAVLAGSPALLGVGAEWVRPVADLPRLVTGWLGSPGLAWLGLPAVALPLLAVASAALYRGSLRWTDRRQV